MTFLKLFIKNYEDLWKNVIQPPRQNYSIESLGPILRKSKGIDSLRSDFTVQSKRGHTLQVSFYETQKNDNAPCVIFLHGINGTRVDCLGHLDSILSRGMSAASFDFSGCGLSEGKYITLGYNESEDVHAVADHLQKFMGINKFVIWGRSMGAVTALMFANQQPAVSCIILDSPYYSLECVVEDMAAEKYKVPRFLAKKGVDIIRDQAKENLGMDIFNLDLRKIAKKLQNCAALIAYSEEDNVVKPYHGEAIYSYFAGEKELYKLEGDHNSPRPKEFSEYAAEYALTQCKKYYRNDQNPQNNPQGEDLTRSRVRRRPSRGNNFMQGRRLSKGSYSPKRHPILGAPFSKKSENVQTREKTKSSSNLKKSKYINNISNNSFEFQPITPGAIVNLHTEGISLSTNIQATPPRKSTNNQLLLSEEALSPISNPWDEIERNYINSKSKMSSKYLDYQEARAVKENSPYRGSSQKQSIFKESFFGDHREDSSITNRNGNIGLLGRNQPNPNMPTASNINVNHADQISLKSAHNIQQIQGFLHNPYNLRDKKSTINVTSSMENFDLKHKPDWGERAQKPEWGSSEKQIKPDWNDTAPKLDWNERGNKPDWSESATKEWNEKSYRPNWSEIPTIVENEKTYRPNWSETPTLVDNNSNPFKKLKNINNENLFIQTCQSQPYVAQVKVPLQQQHIHSQIQLHGQVAQQQPQPTHYQKGSQYHNPQPYTFTPQHLLTASNNNNNNQKPVSLNQVNMFQGSNPVQVHVLNQIQGSSHPTKKEEKRNDYSILGGTAAKGLSLFKNAKPTN